MLRVGVELFEVMLTLPFAGPTPVAASETTNEMLWPTFRVSGNEIPLTLKPVPIAETADIVTLVPLAVKVSILLLVPIRTLPKSIRGGSGASCYRFAKAGKSNLYDEKLKGSQRKFMPVLEEPGVSRTPDMNVFRAFVLAIGLL